MHRLMILLLLLLGSACSRDSESRSSHSFRVFNEDGELIAETTGGSKYEGEIFQYTALLHLKQEESQLETMLGTAGEVYVGENDLVYVRDNKNYRIVVFDLKGDFCFSFGREGSGPGEFNRISRLQLAGDSVLVSDFFLRRVAVFSLDGQFIESIPYPQIPSESALRFSTFFVYPVNASQLVVAQQALERPPGSNMMESAYRIGLVSSGEELIFAVESPLSRLPFPFEGQGSVHYQHGQGILWADGHLPLMSWYNLDGSKRITVRIDVDSEPVTAADREQAREVQQGRIDETEQAVLKQARAERLEQIVFPEYKGFTSDIRADEFGFIWAPEPLDVFADPPWAYSSRFISPDGEYLGDTSFPRIEGMDVSYYISRGYLIYCYLDVETGAPRISLFRIIPAVEELKYP